MKELSVSTILLLILSCYVWDAEARNYQSVLEVPNGNLWGSWGKEVLCPKGFANGFSLKVQEYQGGHVWQDDTSLNSIRLHCSEGHEIESAAGPHGKWTKTTTCPKGNLVSFSLQVYKKELLAFGDGVGANNIQFTCEDGTVLLGESHDWGTFGPWSKRCSTGAICGLQTKVDNAKRVLDQTGLNDVKFFCCN